MIGNHVLYTEDGSSCIGCTDIRVPQQAGWEMRVWPLAIGLQTTASGLGQERSAYALGWSRTSRSTRALGGRAFLLVTFEGVFQRRTLGIGAIDEYAAHHLVLGATSPIWGVAFDSRSFEDDEPAALANDRLPGACRRLD